jgi:hypothetical protein
VKLADVEARFHDLVTAPESVAATLAARGPGALGEIEAIVVGDEGLSAVERLDIYANMYFFRIRDVLRDEYAKTAARVGDDAFHDLVTDYLVACPPNHPSLREAGARLPGFLAAHALGASRPWLAELARLERTRLELHDGPDATPLSEEALRRVPADELGALPLRLIPCHALLDARFAVAALWREEKPVSDPPVQKSETLLVWRSELEVHHRPVDAEETGWLRRLGGAGLRFEAMCEGLAETMPEADAAGRAVALLGRFVADGLLRAPG